MEMIRAYFYGEVQPESEVASVAKLFDALGDYKGPIVVLRFARDREWLDFVVELNKRRQQIVQEITRVVSIMPHSRETWKCVAVWPDGDGWRCNVERETLTAQVDPRSIPQQAAGMGGLRGH